jgi:outer membrane protein assembly factor BamB
MRIHLLVISLVFLSACCEKDDSEIVRDENGVIIDQPWLWRTKLSINSTIGAIIEGPAYFNGVALMGSADENDNAYFSGVEIETGTVAWKQNYIQYTDFFGYHNPYIKDNRITNIDGRTIFQLDLNTGNYLWNKRLDVPYAAQWLSGLDSLFFVIVVEPYPGNNYPVESAYWGNIKDGNIELFLIPDLGDLPEPDMNRVNIAIGGFRYIKPFYDSNTNEIKLLCYYYKNYYLVGSDEQISKSYMGLYNFTQKEWIFEKLVLGDYNWLEGFTPSIINNKVFHTLQSLQGGVIECRDLSDGEFIWRKQNSSSQYSTGGFIIVGNKMIVMDDGKRELVAYDFNTGNRLWAETSAGTNSYLSELNGVVYYGSSGDGRIHAVDIETGKHLWRLKSYDSYNDERYFFMKQCIVVPGENGKKGKVIVSSYSHAYCYEAAK